MSDPLQPPRSKSRTPLRPILFGIFVGVLLLVVGGLFSAGGHNFALIIVFFPWASLLGVTHLDSVLPLLVLALVQFPVYFAVPGIVARGRGGFWAIVAVQALVHIAGVLLCFAVDSSESWRIFFR